MTKQKLLLTIITVTLIVSIGTNLYFAAQPLTSQNQTKLNMITKLTQIQNKIHNEITQIGTSVISASIQLTQTGITGNNARTIVTTLANSSTFIIEAATQNLDRQMMTVEPDAWHTNEGKIIGTQRWLNPNPIGDITPTMTPTIMLITNQSGCSIVAPIFDSNQNLIGTVSAIFDPQELVAAAIAEVVPDPNYSFTATQLDGLVVYSGNPDFQNKNLFTDNFPAQYNGIKQSAQVTAQSVSGYQTYTVGSQQRESFWTTLTSFGQDWRLVIHHAI